MTNREWLESLSDEEFAKTMRDEPCKHLWEKKRCCGMDCNECTERWLQSEHKDKGITNGEYTRSRNDKELASMIANLACSMTNCSHCNYFENGCKDTMVQECMDWFKEEYKNND